MGPLYRITVGENDRRHCGHLAEYKVKREMGYNFVIFALRSEPAETVRALEMKASTLHTTEEERRGH